jgi:hypothetical protein
MTLDLNQVHDKEKIEKPFVSDLGANHVVQKGALR